jgi:hypothetical protein
MLRTLFILMVLLATPTAYGDTIVDVRQLASQSQIWIALDEQPDAIDVASTPGRLALRLSGFELDAPRRVVPTQSSLVRSLVFQPGIEGSQIEILGGFGRGYAELRQGGILIDLSDGAYQAAMQAGRVGSERRQEQEPPGPYDSGDAWGGAQDAYHARESEADQAALAQRAAGRSSGSLEQGDGDQRAAGSHAALPERLQSETGPDGTQTQPDARPVSEFRIGDPIDDRTPSGGLWLMEPDDPEPGAEVPSSAPRSETPVAEAVPSQQADPAQAQEGGVDLSSVPGETELVSDEGDQPGPCDATAAVIASSPWDLDALADHAGCLVQIGEEDNGAGLYERVLAFDPGHFQAALGLARLRERQGRRQDAARLFETAADAARTDGQALSARAAARRLRGDD